MRNFEYMLSIARGFAVPEQEARQAMADSIRPEPVVPERGGTGPTASKMPTHRKPPPEESAA